VNDWGVVMRRLEGASWKVCELFMERAAAKGMVAGGT
jgi:hypothetical protein